MKRRIENINREDYKNIYVVGDIHGMFHLLEYYLKEINFNKEEDLLICCGDLIDRGSSSHQAKEYLLKKWFKSTIGNHDFIFTKKNIFEEDLISPLEKFTHDLSEIDKLDFKAIFEDLPLAIEISFNSVVKVACLHAEMPRKYKTWKEFKNSIYNESYDSLQSSIWGRQISRICLARNKTHLSNEKLLHFLNQKDLFDFPELRNGENLTNKIQELEKELVISDLDAIFHGHTIISSNGYPDKFANRYFIDTGAFLSEEYETLHGEKYIPNKDFIFGFTIFNVDNLEKEIINPKIFLDQNL